MFPIAKEGAVRRRAQDVVDSILSLPGTQAHVIELDDPQGINARGDRLVGSVVFFRGSMDRTVVLWCNTLPSHRNMGLQAAAWKHLGLDPRKCVAAFPPLPVLDDDRFIISGWAALWMMRHKMPYDPFMVSDVIIDDIINRVLPRLQHDPLAAANQRSNYDD